MLFSRLSLLPRNDGTCRAWNP